MTQAIPTFEGHTTDSEATADDIDLEVNDDDNLDVDTPNADEADVVPAEGTSPDAKAAKATSTPRTKAPEGFVKPVEFAKILSEHLGKTVPPQVVYSYVKNNGGEGAKNPFPVHAVDGYAWYIKPEEGLAWWDAKNTRVAASKAANAAKAAAKAEKPAAVVEAEDSTPVVEAE
jgi:hypothetical protein